MQRHCDTVVAETRRRGINPVPTLINPVEHNRFTSPFFQTAPNAPASVGMAGGAICRSNVAAIVGIAIGESNVPATARGRAAAPGTAWISGIPCCSMLPQAEPAVMSWSAPSPKSGRGAPTPAGMRRSWFMPQEGAPANCPAAWCRGQLRARRHGNGRSGCIVPRNPCVRRAPFHRGVPRMSPWLRSPEVAARGPALRPNRSRPGRPRLQANRRARRGGSGACLFFEPSRSDFFSTAGRTESEIVSILYH